jgi:aminomethyltransferase
MSNSVETLSRTALHEAHRLAGARLVPFAGWDMPVQYSGVIDEVRAVREGCGIFDVSHMGQLDVSGPNATAELNKIVSADWSNVGLGRTAYALLLNEQGGVIDDIMGYRLGEDEWMIVVNASRATVDEARFRALLPSTISLSNRYEQSAMLAIQGLKSLEVLQTLSPDNLSEWAWRDARPATIAGAQGLLARGGYTGCDGFEFMFPNSDAERVWNALVEAGAVPNGLGARDVLRLEAGLPLYGHELREEWTPYESGCGFAVKPAKGEFPGRAALQGNEKPARRIRGLKMQGRAIPREHYPVARSGETIGEVTSGTLSPALGVGIALALLPAHLETGDVVDVMVRGTAHPAEIVATPFVAHGRQKS